MFKKLLGVVVLVGLLSAHAAGQDAKTVISNASRAMGADSLKTLQFTATGWEYTFGQAVNAKSPWPGYESKTYTRTINFETSSASR